MARRFPIVRRLDVTATTGLVPPTSPPERHPLFWAEDDRRRAVPEVIRFVWLPTTGELRVGLQLRHDLQLLGHAAPPAAWLRGYSFPHDGAIALGRYHWPDGPADAWDAAHGRLNLRVARSFVRAVRPHLPERTLVYLDADDRSLADRFGHRGHSW